MSVNINEIAKNAFKQRGIVPTKDKLNSVIASVRISGINTNDEKAVMACAGVAVESSMKFDYSALLKKETPKPSVNPKLNFTDRCCPRCGKPMVLAHIMNRDVSYCTSGCRIALPFQVGK